LGNYSACLIIEREKERKRRTHLGVCVMLYFFPSCNEFFQLICFLWEFLEEKPNGSTPDWDFFMLSAYHWSTGKNLWLED
jgi:hypothetical protein